MSLETGTFVLSLWVALILTAALVSGIVFGVKYYGKIVDTLEKQDFVMCCVGNLCNNPILNPNNKCPIPPSDQGGSSDKSRDASGQD